MIDAEGRPLEIELKYEAPDAATAAAPLAAGRLGPFAVGPAGTPYETHDRYVDTADRRLLAGGWVARLRERDGATVLTLKSVATRHGAAHRRIEHEAPAGPSLLPGDWPPSGPRAILLELVAGSPLVVLGAARQRRTPYELVADDARVEATVDEVEVLDGDRPVVRFVELEAELRDGSEERLGELAAVLGAAPGLSPATRSKMERTLEAAGALPPRRPGIRPDDTVAEAGRKVLRIQLDRLVAREAGARLGEDPGELKAMRVATRRLRAAWRVFEAGWREGRTRTLRKRLRTLGDLLGAVRDRDVLLAGLERHLESLPPAERAGLEPFAEELRHERWQARLDLVRELDAEEHRRWLDEFRAFVTTAGAASVRPEPGTPSRIRETAASALWSAYEGVRVFEPLLGAADDSTLHDLRIAAKRLRYTIEFLREVLPAEADELVARLVVLQDHLGELNDAVVAGGLARRFAAERADGLDEGTAIAVGHYVAGREREMERLRAGIGDAWAGVGGAEFRAALGRVTGAI